jgi:hypothetical protein
MAIAHSLLRFDPSTMRRALLFAAVACCAASAALSQTEPPAQSALEMSIITSVNEMRRSAKLSALKPDPALSKVAREHSVEMMKGGKVTHASALDGRKTPAERYARAFGRAAGKIEELVAVVDPAFSEELLALDAHMQLNLTGASYAIAGATDVSTIGVGCAVGKDGRVWITELFAQTAGRAQPAPQPVITTKAPSKTSPESPPNRTPYPQLDDTTEEPPDISLLPSPDPPRSPQPRVTTKVPPKITLLPSADPPRDPQPGTTTKVQPKTLPARPPDPQSPTGPVVYEGTLGEEFVASLWKDPGHFGGDKLVSINCDPIRMVISRENDSVTISPVVMELVVQPKKRRVTANYGYEYYYDESVHVRYEWSFVPGRFSLDSNAGGYALLGYREKKSRASDEQGKPVQWKDEDVTTGPVVVQSGDWGETGKARKVQEPKYSKSEYRVQMVTGPAYRDDWMFVLKPVSAPAPPPPAPPPPETKTHDGFLTWYLGFSRLLQDSRNRINDARAVAATIALPLENARRELQRLVRAVAEAARARQAGEPTASTEITDRLAEKGRLLSEECQKYLAQLDAASADAKSAQDKVMTEFNRGFDAYAGDDLPMWIRWREHFDLITASLPFEMAIAAGEDVRLREAVERSDTQTLPAPLRVRLAKAMISRGEFALAINQLHRVLAIDPQNADARELLARAEIVVMKVSMKKASGALGLARASFNNLLDAAGYADRMLQPADWMPEATPDAIKLLAGGIDWLFTEAWERVTHTAINVMDRGTGRTVGEARALRASEREYVAHFMAIPIMMRLREKGFTLEQMSRMDTAALKAAIPLNTVGGVPYTDAQVTRLGIAIRNALAFEDIAAIRNQEMDVEDLKRALDKPYFAPADMVDTWVDEFGSMVVKEAILLALPMAELSAGGATVTEFLGHITRYEKAVQWFGGTETGLRLLKPLKQYQVLQEALIKAGTLSSYGKFAALKGSEMMAMMMAGDYAVNLADKYGGAPAAAVTSALSMMVTDLDLLTKWLEAGRVSTQMATRIMATAIRQAQTDVQRMEQGGTTLKRLRELSRPRPAGQAIPSADTAVVQRAERLETAFVPNGDPLHDSNLVRAHLAEDISSGASSDAARVSQQFENDLNTKKTSISVEVQRAEAARLKLAAARPAAVVGGPRRVPKNQGGYEIPLSPKPGSAWAEAEKALQNGEYDRAKLLYHKAYYDNHELTESLFYALDTRVAEAKDAVRFAISAKQPTSAEFATGQAEDILRNKWHLKTPLKRSDRAATSEVFGYSDENGSYILKEVKIGGWIDDEGKEEAIQKLYSVIDNNIVTARLMDALGIPCARVTAVVTKDKNGEIATARFLMRKINGKNMDELSPGDLYKYATDLSEQRPFALMIGDYDRKPPNSMRGDDGYVYYIDPDQAYLRDQRLLDNSSYDMRPKYEEGYWGQDHWYVRSKQIMEALAGKKDKESEAEVIKMMRYHIAERCLTANRAQPMVQKIKSMLDSAPENEAGILNILTSAYRESRATNYATYTDAEIRKFAEDALKTMRFRQQRFPEVLKHLNERNGLPLPDETNPLKLLRLPTPLEPIARAPREEWRVAA